MLLEGVVATDVRHPLSRASVTPCHGRPSFPAADGRHFRLRTGGASGCGRAALAARKSAARVRAFYMSVSAGCQLMATKG